jgi:drug/metabolite transporter (DMT)-like permease
LGAELGAVVWGLMAALSWGVGDFSGGSVTRRMPVIAVLALSHVLGLGLMIFLALVTSETVPPAQDWLFGALAGLCGAVGLAALYQGLAIGNAGVVAPITAVVSAALPVFWSILNVGLPSTNVQIGLVVGLIGVVLVSLGMTEKSSKPSGIWLALLSGLGFGGFYILLDGVQSNAVFYPLVGARLASATLALLIVFGRRISWQPPTRNLWAIIALSGGLDAIANVFFLLSTQSGQLAVTSVVSSLYPVVTIVLAWFIRRERLTFVQVLGIGAGLAAVMIIGIDKAMS